MYTPLLGEIPPPPATVGVELYAIHRPSGEKTDPIGSDDSTPPYGIAFVSAIDSIQSENVEPLSTENDTCLPSGDHDSGTCASPFCAFVRRSNGPLPSARCEKIPRSPSRSD